MAKTTSRRPGRNFADLEARHHPCSVKIRTRHPRLLACLADLLVLDALIAQRDNPMRSHRGHPRSSAYQDRRLAPAANTHDSQINTVYVRSLSPAPSVRTGLTGAHITVIPHHHRD